MVILLGETISISHVVKIGFIGFITKHFKLC